MNINTALKTLAIPVFAFSLPLHATVPATSGVATITKIGSTSFQVGASFTSESDLRLRPSLEMDHSFQKGGSGSQSPARVPASHVPKPAGNSIAQAPASLMSFDGLTVRQQGLASGFTVEPPDQALAVGQGFVLEGVNLAITVYDANTGVQLTPAVGLNDFFKLSPDAFTSDPKALYDAQTGHWFVTILEINPSFTAASVLIAVSQTSDPTGSYNIFALDSTDTATPGCPCFGDQPLIGADANGFFVNTNEFGLSNSAFVGTQIFAVDKAALAAGSATVNTQSFLLTSNVFPIFFSLQPATTPPGGNFMMAQGGTEFFLGSLDDFNVLTNQIAVMALTNTGSLPSAPDLHLQQVMIDSEVYGPPPASQQPLVPVAQYPVLLPLADALRNDPLGTAFGGPFNEHEELTDSNDDRMAQVVFADGKLFGALDTVVKTEHGPATAGIAWFAVTPKFDGDTLTAAMANQGYVSVDGQNVNYPSIGVNAAGKGVMSFTVVGPDFNPSAAFATFDADVGAGDVQILAAGFRPDDGFTGYAPFGNRVARWGDYSAAVADENGDIWLATEYIPDKQRLTFANWGTRISRVTP
ncbi:MAG: hypothetical protein KGJ55_05440 [Gammaproteobacteria bacterium]|nr:hypothetical protein [Gammaproteobacteria bacterium]